MTVILMLHFFNKHDIIIVTKEAASATKIVTTNSLIVHSTDIGNGVAVIVSFKDDVVINTHRLLHVAYTCGNIFNENNVFFITMMSTKYSVQTVKWYFAATPNIRPYLVWC